MLEEYLSDELLRSGAVGKRAELEIRAAVETYVNDLIEKIEDKDKIRSQVLADWEGLLSKVRKLGESSPIDPAWIAVVVAILTLIYQVLQTQTLLKP